MRPVQLVLLCTCLTLETACGRAPQPDLDPRPPGQPLIVEVVHETEACLPWLRGRTCGDLTHWSLVIGEQIRCDWEKAGRVIAAEAASANAARGQLDVILYADLNTPYETVQRGLKMCENSGALSLRVRVRGR